MSIGKSVRLNRIFAHPTGRLCSVAVDHLMAYGLDLPAGLRHIGTTLQAIVDAKPDAVTMHKGIASSCWGPHAGKTPLIVQASFIRPDDSIFEHIATPEDAIRLGADAIAIAGFVKGDTEARHLRAIADCVREAARFELPVICHIYPRKFSDSGVDISFEPEDVAFAVRCAVEVGVDVVKAPFCGDVAAYRNIVADCPLPLVAAGGPKTDTLAAALAMMGDVVEGGGLGATIGRNIWGFPHIRQAVEAFKSVIHDRLTPEAALQRAGLAG